MKSSGCRHPTRAHADQVEGQTFGTTSVDLLVLRDSSFKVLEDTPRFVALNHRTAEGRPESRGRPEQAADASDVKRRGGAEVRVGCSGAAATGGRIHPGRAEALPYVRPVVTSRSTARGPALLPTLAPDGV